jgi:hypothetical protein
LFYLLTRARVSYIPTMNDKWVHTGAAPAINQTLATYNMLLRLGDHHPTIIPDFPF